MTISEETVTERATSTYEAKARSWRPQIKDVRVGETVMTRWVITKVGTDIERDAIVSIMAKDKVEQQWDRNAVKCELM